MRQGVEPEKPKACCLRMPPRPGMLATAQSRASPFTHGFSTTVCACWNAVVVIITVVVITFPDVFSPSHSGDNADISS